MDGSNSPIGPLGCTLPAQNVYFKRRLVEATISRQLLSPYWRTFYCVGFPSNSKMPDRPAHYSWYSVYVLCVNLLSIHTCLNLISLRLMTGVVNEYFLEIPGQPGYDLYSSIKC